MITLEECKAFKEIMLVEPDKQKKLQMQKQLMDMLAQYVAETRGDKQ